MDEEEFFGLFPSIAEAEIKEYEEQILHHKVRPNIYTEFVAKRNASRIDHYFVNTKYSLKKVSMYFLFAASLVAILIFLLIEMNSSVNDRIRIHVENTLNSIQFRVTASIDGFTTDASFFSGFLAELFSTSHPLIELATENAKDLVYILNTCKQITGNNVFWWDIGVKNGGQLFGLTTFTYQQQKYMSSNYGYTFENGTGYLHAWWSNNGDIPDDYPDGTPDQTQPYNLYHREWYQLAEKKNTSYWTKPIIEDGLIPFELTSRSLLVSITTPVNENATFQGAVANSIGLQHLQSILRRLTPSKNSRIVLIDEARNVVAMNSRDIAVELWNNTVVMKDVGSLNDPVWECASHQSTNLQSYQFRCFVDGEIKSYYYGFHELNMVGNQTWTLLSAICIDDFLGTAENQYFFNFTFSILLIIFGCTPTFVFMLVNNRWFTAIQSKIINEPEDESKNVPLEESYRQHILKIKRSHSHNKTVVKILTNIRKREKDMPTDQFYNPRKILRNLSSNNPMRELMIYRFGILDTGEYSRVRNYPRFHSADSTVSETSKKVNVQKVFTSSPHGGADGLIQPTKRLAATISRNDQILLIIHIFEEINNRLLFNDLLMEELLNNFLSKLDDTVMQLTADSFDFLYFVLSNRLPNVLITTDLSLSVFTALLIWHLSMHQRCQEKSLCYRYFSHNPETRYIIGDEVLMMMEKSRVPEVLYDTKRWNKFIFDVTNFLHTFPLKEQIYNIRLFEKISTSREESLSVREEHVLLSVLLAMSQSSYLFHSPQTAQSISLLINNGVTNDEIKGFEQNIKEEIIFPSLKCLKSVMDTNILEDLML